MTQAIFLSYASQDADAARGICEALRAAGLEVWFDQAELRGGDAWDASIRKQIKECALFVPIVSANTDSRPEGYFRLEWKLAVDRSHLMADDQPFFVPVILGETAETTARVPEKFRERQWTRLNDEVSTKAFAERIAKLASGSASSSKNASTSPSNNEDDAVVAALRTVAPAKAGAQVSSASHGQANLGPVLQRDDKLKSTEATGDNATSTKWIAIASVVFGLGAAMWFVLNKPAPKDQGAQSTSNAALATSTRDPNLKRAVDIIESTNALVSDVALAEDLTKAVLDQRPTDVDATIVMARIHSYLLLRGWDRSEERFASAKRFSERALALAPNSPQAMGAMVTYLYMRRGVELPRAAKLAREAIALAPDDPYHYRMLVNVLSVTPGVADDDVMASAKQMTERFPKDALAHYELGRIARDAGRVEEAEKAFDLAIKHGSVANAIIAQSRLRLWLHNDTAGMKALLDTIPERMRTTDRAVMSQILYGMAIRDYKLSMSALTSLPDPWMSDFDYTGPTALLAGEILLLQGKPESAKLRFTEAQAELSRRKPVMTRNFNTVWLDSWVLMRLGKMDEARARNNLVYQELARPFRANAASSWMFTLIPRNLLLGERGKALELMREAADKPITRALFRNAMEIDPRMAPFRNDKEIVAILAEPKSKP